MCETVQISESPTYRCASTILQTSAVSEADVALAVIYAAHVRYNTAHMHGIIRARSPSKVAS